MSKSISPIILIGGGLAAYFLFLKPKTTSVIPTGTTLIPGSTIPVAQTYLPVTTSVPQGVQTAAYGINSGVKGGNGSFYTCSNYSQLLQLYPNLGNPNYQMSAAENAQYLANYQDLATAMPLWVGHKQMNGTTPQNIQQAAQAHWNYYGCAEKRIFIRLSPPSTAAYIPPPVNPTSSGGGSFLSGALQIAGAALPYIIALAGVNNDPKLNNADLQLLFTGGAVLNDILPLYANSDSRAASDIHERFNNLLKQYS